MNSLQHIRYYPNISEILRFSEMGGSLKSRMLSGFKGDSAVPFDTGRQLVPDVFRKGPARFYREVSDQRELSSNILTMRSAHPFLDSLEG